MRHGCGENLKQDAVEEGGVVYLEYWTGYWERKLAVQWIIVLLVTGCNGYEPSGTAPLISTSIKSVWIRGLPLSLSFDYFHNHSNYCGTSKWRLACLAHAANILYEL